MKILVTGGAGYIGSHCVLGLMKNGFECVVLDNLSEGHKKAVKCPDFIQGDLANLNDIQKVFDKHKIDAVVHFAAYAYVGESVQNPQKYYYNNVVNTLNLLKIMLENNVKNIVFSSTCATYGNPQYMPIDEKHPQNPINPYGYTKLVIENILKDYNKAYKLNYIILRYFNASGADESTQIGESHNIETHLIPLVLKVATGEKQDIKIFGNDYDTPDGTCIRDYIHVNDLSLAHRLAIEKLLKEKISGIYNLGTGRGYSVKEVIGACEKITGQKIAQIITQRREGDPPILYASNDKAKKELGWSFEYTNINDIIKTAWQWEKNKLF